MRHQPVSGLAIVSPLRASPTEPFHAALFERVPALPPVSPFGSKVSDGA